MSGRKNLFRAEAIRHYAPSDLGAPVIYQPVILKVMTIGLVAMFFAALVFISVTKVKSTERAAGITRPLEGMVKLYPSANGIIDEIYALEGQHVEEGDLLVKIDTQQFNESGIDKTAAAVQRFQEELKNLQRERELAEKSLEAEHARLRNLAEGNKLEIKLLRQELNLADRRSVSSKQDLVIHSRLRKQNTISTRQYKAYENAHLDLLQLIQSRKLRLQTALTELEDYQHRIKLAQIRLDQKYTELDSKRNEIGIRIQELENSRFTTILAPTSGVVTAVTAIPGDVSSVRMPLLSITPHDYQLQAELYVPARTIGRLEVGQELLLTYDAFAFQTYGNYSGFITSISESTVDPREHFFLVLISEPVFLVRAELQDQEVRSVSEGEVVSLQAGMSFKAQITIKDMTILQHLVEPLARLVEDF